MEGGSRATKITCFGQTNAVLAIELDGTNAGEVSGLTLNSLASGTAGNETIIEGLAINRFSDAACCGDNGILMQGAVHDVIVRGNFIGTDAGGASSIGYANGSRGMFLDIGDEVNDSRILIGGPALADRNLISNNQLSGITLSGSRGVTVQNNLIGTDHTGLVDFGNTDYGVNLSFSTETTVTGNLISGNDFYGVVISASSTNLLSDNRIGTSWTGGTGLPNQGGGIDIRDLAGVPASFNEVSDNVISFNSGPGIFIERFTVDNVGNRLSRNSLVSNTGLGIDLAPVGVNANDAMDTDTGTNNGQNFPVVTGATGNGATLDVEWTFSGASSESFQFEFFHSPSCGSGVAQTYLGEVTSATNGSGSIGSTLTPFASAQTSGGITMTARNVSNADTSELSACVGVAAAPASPGTVQLGATAPSVGEAAGPLEVPVTRTGGSSGAAAVTCTAGAPGTAASGTDYAAGMQLLTWADGDSSTKLCSIGITDDVDPEADETFTVSLTGASGAALGAQSSATATILDDDAAVAPADVPTLDGGGLAGLVALLAISGLVAVRRRRLA